MSQAFTPTCVRVACGRGRDAVALHHPGLCRGRPLFSVLLAPVNLAKSERNVPFGGCHPLERIVEEGPALLLRHGRHRTDAIGTARHWVAAALDSCSLAR